MKEYLGASNAKLKQLLYVMNPSKLRAVEYLVRFHEARGDKIILFSDLVYSLTLYGKKLKKPMIYGLTPERERQGENELLNKRYILPLCVPYSHSWNFPLHGSHSNDLS